MLTEEVEKSVKKWVLGRQLCCKRVEKARSLSPRLRWEKAYTGAFINATSINDGETSVEKVTAVRLASLTLEASNFGKNIKSGCKSSVYILCRSSSRTKG